MKKYYCFLAILCSFFFLVGCDALQKATNSTGSAFTLTGQWKLASNDQENVTLGVGTIVTVAPVLAEARITNLVGSANCLRQNDVVWKNIAADGANGFSMNNLVSGCNGLNYQPALISIISNTEIKVTGKTATGVDQTETWNRIK